LLPRTLYGFTVDGFAEEGFAEEGFAAEGFAAVGLSVAIATKIKFPGAGFVQFAGSQYITRA
jgi:hypothetical protein